MISAPEINLNPVEFYWNSVDSVLMPNECIITLLLVAVKKNALENVSAPSFFL